MGQVVCCNKIFGMGKGKKAVEDADRSNAKAKKIEALVQDFDDDPDKQDGKREQRDQDKDTQEGQLIGSALEAIITKVQQEIVRSRMSSVLLF